MMSLEPKKPIATCESDSCNDCTVKSDLHCHFSLKDWLLFLIIAIPPFLIGGKGISNIDSILLLPWILFVVVYFGFIEIRVMCSHCPHYAEASTSLQCWANYGSPKLWKYRPGPMSVMEKIVFLGGFVIVWGYPLISLLLSTQIFLLIIYSMTTTSFFLILLKFMCSRCMNFACPLNQVDEQIRDRFFSKNPRVAEAWEKSGRIK
ncbi:MAG: hypothetical protein QNJ17_05670 [Desulfocapsaceae bacterium]|nr:hypothetical protein [Desulfocapsaceae bacterium]